MRRVRFISTQPYEVLGFVRSAGDILEVDDEVAEDLLRRSEMFEDAEPKSSKKSHQAKEGT